MGRLARKWLILPVALLCAALLSGCYTQLMTYQGETAGKRSPDYVRDNDCGECEDVAPASNRREVCVWERDILGFPELRCYNTNYHSSWVYFHNTPWWYRNTYGWYDNRGCPPYYYYDRIAGVCRYYDSGGGGHKPGKPGGKPGKHEPEPPVRPNARVVPPSGTSATVSDNPPIGTPMFHGGSKQLSPVGSPLTPTPSTPQGSGQTMTKPQEGASEQTSTEGRGPEKERETTTTPPRPNSRVVPPSSGGGQQQQPGGERGSRDESEQNQPQRRTGRGM
jgi:hypothetical protein